MNNTMMSCKIYGVSAHTHTHIIWTHVYLLEGEFINFGTCIKIFDTFTFFVSFKSKRMNR